MRGMLGSSVDSGYNAWIAECNSSKFSLSSPSYSTIDSVPSSNDGRARFASVLSSPFNKRLPFVSLVQPENYLSRVPIWDCEPEPSCSMRLDLTDYKTNIAALWSGQGGGLYKLAMHNFLAEVPEFFLESGLSSITSKPIPADGIKISSKEADNYYVMDVVLSNSKVRSFTDFYHTITLPKNAVYYNKNYNLSENEIDQIVGKNLEINFRDSSFGPPSNCGVLNFTASNTAEAYHYSYEPYTPSYYNGMGLARLKFFPYKGPGNYTLSEIMTHTTASYIRMPTYRSGSSGLRSMKSMLEWQTLSSLDANLLSNVSEQPLDLITGRTTLRNVYLQAASFVSASNNWSSLSSSVELFGQKKIPKATYDSSGALLTNEATELDVQEEWIIYPKWETPILDGGQSGGSVGAVPSSRLRYGGLWHGSGNLPQSQEGIVLSVGDSPSAVISNNIGSIFNDRAECEVQLKKDNSYVELYIRDWTLLANSTLILDGCTLTEGVNWNAVTSNYRTAMSIETAINYSSNVAGSRPYPVPLRYRMSASIFVPNERNPWEINSNVATVAANYDVVAGVKIQIVDVPYTHYDEAVCRYPNYYASGKTGNQKTAQIPTLPLAWMLRGGDEDSEEVADFSNTMYSADKVKFAGGKDNKYIAKSLADLVGFAKTSRQLGNVAKKRIIKEAVVVLPFVEDSSGARKFFADSKRTNIGSLKEFVFPPKLDYNLFPVEPVQMIVAPFSMEVKQEDLAKIWRNVAPSNCYYHEEEEVDVTKSVEELFGSDQMPKNLRFMVFKVKQRAKTNYFKILPTVGANEVIPECSYNWPYDQMSILELAEIEAEIKMKRKA
jgi:hypothetical protein